MKLTTYRDFPGCRILRARTLAWEHCRTGERQYGLQVKTAGRDEPYRHVCDGRGLPLFFPTEAAAEAYLVVWLLARGADPDEVTR